MDDNQLLKTLIEASSPVQKTAELEKFYKDTLKLTSVFDITRLTEAEFKDRFNCAIQNDNALKDHASGIDTGAFYDNVKCLAAQISHLYREQQTSDGNVQHQWHPPGIRAIENQGPTYTNLFKENWDDACKVDSIAAIDSPVAYLRALYLFALQLESSTSVSAPEKDNRILLGKRRPDLAKLSIDQQSTFTAQPLLKIVNDILDKSIQAGLESTDDKGKSTYEVLAQTRYPFALPYEFFHHQCLLGLGAKKTALGELNYLVSDNLPVTQSVNTLYGSVLSASSVEAQMLMSGLGPKRQALLTDTANANLTAEEKNYWKDTYGTASTSDLKKIDIFLERTELKAEQMEALLAQGKYAPRTSPHYSLPAPYSQPYGARYVNGSVADNASIMFLDRGERPGEIINATAERLERLHRMIRLQRWLDIPFTELDTLICSAFESQRPLNTSMQLDRHVMRALGVYHFLNRRYCLTAEEFGALLHQISPYACGDHTALFDQLFNQARLFDTPLKLDGRTFKADNSDPVSHTILQHLSACLGLPLTEDSLLLVVKNTEKFLGSLKCDLRTLSSIYRQARIARMFGLSVAESSTLASLLGGESVLSCLASGDSGMRRLRIKASKDVENAELTVRFRLTAQRDAQNPDLLSGSTLRMNTSRFANKDTINEFRVLMTPTQAGDLPFISISQIPTVSANEETSLEEAVIQFKGGTLDELLRRKSQLALLITTRRDNSDITTTYPIVTLTEEQPQGLDAFNLLDVLMQMDWITRWIKESVYDIPKLQQLLEPTSGNDHASGDLQQHLTKLRAETLQCAVTPQELAALSLPEKISWRTKLARTLLDTTGLVKDFASAINDDVPQKLAAELDNVVDVLTLDANSGRNLELQADCKQKLKRLLLLAHDRQQHLIEKFLQETTLLPMNCAKGVLVWAQTSVHQILVAALQTEDSLNLHKILRPVLRHAEAAVRLQLSNRALRVFLHRPHLLDKPNTALTLTLSSLYLLDRFNHCRVTYKQTEESLLSYLEFANDSASTTPAINDRLAQLLNWTTTEVTVLTARLDLAKARTMKDIDGVMRYHKTCKATGLSAAALLNATALNNQSPATAWKTVGEAVMATSH